MTVLEYVAKFTKLARFADDYVTKVRKFDGLKLSIRGEIVALLQDMDLMVKAAIVTPQNPGVR